MRTRKVNSGTILRHTLSKSHNANEIERWKKMTGKDPVCCVKKNKQIPKGTNAGNSVGDCSEGRHIGAHVRFEGSNKLYIVPVCNRHNDTGWKSNPFQPGSWFEAKGTVAVPATDKNPKTAGLRRKKTKGRRKKSKTRICQRPVKGTGRCHQHKYQRKGRKNSRKGICGAKLN